MPPNVDKRKVERRVLGFIKDYSELTNRFKSPQITCPAEELEGLGILDLKAIIESLPEYDLHGEMSERKLIAKKHWVDPSKMNCPGSEAHDPILEKIASVTVNGTVAIVTTLHSGTWPSRREYQLKLRRTVWKIERLLYFHEGDSIPEKSNSSLLGLPIPKLFNLRDICNKDLSLPFKEGVVFHHPISDAGAARVIEVGNLDIPSGRLIVHASSNLDEAQPLALRIPKGKHPVSLSANKYVVGAVRVQWSPLEDLLGYVPVPELEGKKPYSAYLSRSSLMIADGQYILGLSSAERERLWQDGLDGLKLMKKGDGFQLLRKSVLEVFPDDGFGSFPCYVGINSGGKPLCLVIDLCAFGYTKEHHCDCPFEMTTDNGFVRNSMLDEFELSPIRIARNGNRLTIAYTSVHSMDAELLDLDKYVLDKTKNHVSSSGEGQREICLDIPADFHVGILRFRWTTWSSDLEIVPHGKTQSK